MKITQLQFNHAVLPMIIMYTMNTPMLLINTQSCMAILPYIPNASSIRNGLSCVAEPKQKFNWSFCQECDEDDCNNPQDKSQHLHGAGKAMIPAPITVVDRLNIVPLKEAPLNSLKLSSPCLVGSNGDFSSTIACLLFLDFFSLVGLTLSIVIFKLFCQTIQLRSNLWTQ